MQQWTGKTLASVNGTLLLVKGVLHADVPIEGAKFKAAFVVCSGLLVEALVGLDFVHSHGCIIDCAQRILFFPSKGLSLGLQASSHFTQVIDMVGLMVTEQVIVPAESEIEIMVRPARAVSQGHTWFVENNCTSRH